MSALRYICVTILIMVTPMLARANVDFLEQHVTVDLTGTDMTVEATVRLVVTEETEGLLLMNPTMYPFASLTWNGTPLEVSDQGWYSTVLFPSLTPAGTEGMLTAVMKGKPNCSLPGGQQICRAGPDGSFLLAQANDGPWYLMNVGGDAMDTFTGSLSLRLPAGQRAAAMGAVPQITDNDDNSETWVFSFDWPTLFLTFVAGSYEEIQSAPGGFPVRGLYPDDAKNRQIMQEIIDEASRMADLLGKLWGKAPMQELQYATFAGNTAFAGTSAEGLILLNDLIYRDEFSYLLPQVNHELCHVWWGTLASSYDQNDFGFFTESLGEYSLWRALGELEGETRRRNGTRMNAVWYMYRKGSNDVPVLSERGTEAAILAIYHKGSTVVRTIEEAVGVAALDAALTEMIKAGPYSASIAGFVSAIDANGGGDLSPYVTTWLEGTGYPKIKIKAAAAEGDQKTKLTLSAAGDAFPMQIPVKIYLADGTDVAATLDYTGGKAEAQVELDGAPVLVEVDPQWTAVREVAPSVAGDVSFDGIVDGADLIEVALRVGGFLPDTRRVDGAYDPLYDLDGSRKIDEADLDAVVTAAQ